MAAVTRVKARPISPPGYEVNFKGEAAAALVAGDIVAITSTTPSRGFSRVVDKLPTADAGGVKKAYVVLMDCPAGGAVNLSDDVQMDGWTGLPAGDPVYPSGSAAGGIDTAATGSAPARMWADSTTSIRFRL